MAGSSYNSGAVENVEETTLQLGRRDIGERRLDCYVHLDNALDNSDGSHGLIGDNYFFRITG